MKKHTIISIIFLALLALVAVPKIISIIKGPAPTPGIFEAAYTLEQATAQSESTGKPMLVLVTADWCPPCQALKRGALTNSDVIDWVTNNTIPVYLEDGTNPDQIRTLPVKSFPTTFVIQDGEIMGKFSGNASAKSFLSKVQSMIN